MRIRWITILVGILLPGVVWGQGGLGESSGGLETGQGRGEQEVQREGARADGETGVEGAIRLGGEWDTNAGRVAPVGAAVSDGLMRYYLSLDGDVYDDGRTRLGFDLQQGGKAFLERSSNNALLTSMDATLSRRLTERGSKGASTAGDPTDWWWVLDARLKDRIEQESKQDYSRGSLKSGIRMRTGPVALRGTVGWGFFAFRPNPAASSHGPRGTLLGTVWLGESWYAQPSYTLAWRLFESTRFVLRETSGGGENPQRDRTGENRRDLLHVGRMSLGYRGGFLVRGTYELLVNRSNSYGQRLVRHGAIVVGTVPLPWRLYVSARLELQRTDYEDPIFVGRDFTVDENNRNAAVLAVSRSIGEHWDVEARWRAFTEEFGAAAEYRRQTVGVNVGYGW